MNDFLAYQPYRFNRLARAAQRQGRDLSAGTLSASDLPAAIEGDGIPLSELQNRTKDIIRVTQVFNAWAASGRQIFDLSDLIQELAGSVGIELSEVHQAVYPPDFYIHFGPNAGLHTRGECTDFIEGAYVRQTDRSGIAGLEFIYVCGARPNENPDKMGLSQILRTQSRVAFAFAPLDNLPALFSSLEAGDPCLIQDPVMAAVASRALVALKYIGTLDINFGLQNDQEVWRPVI